MGLLPKEKPKHKPLFPEMKQEVRKKEQYSNEIRLIVSEKLKTANYILEDTPNVKKVIEFEK